MNMAGTVVHRGGCHCGRVRFEVDAPARVQALDCNCSICRMTGFLHLIVPAARFRLLTDASELSEYRWNTGVARQRNQRKVPSAPFFSRYSPSNGLPLVIDSFHRAEAGTESSS